jgi:salicylate hydroxylase
LFRAWGLEEVIEEAAAEPTFLAVHRYADGRVLAMEEDFDLKMRAKYGAPFLDLHRVDLQKFFYRRAIDLGVQVQLGARVAKVDPDNTEVTLESSEKHTGDLIVGADGLWSRCREPLLGRIDSPLPTGDLAYRIVLTLDQISDPELRDWVSKPSVHFWIGPDAHAVGYSVRSGTMYNIVLLCPDDLPKDVSRQAGSVDEMRKIFDSWDPILTRFLDHVDSVDKWKLMHRAELESWTNEKGSFVLIGDSCHPMLPYLAQGANSSIEDGGVLGRLLGSVESKLQLPQAIKLYEQLRKARSEAIVRETFHQRNAFHMPDGPQQRERDEIFASQLGKEVTCKFPSRWTCAEVQPWLYGYDAYKEADAALEARPFTLREKSGQPVIRTAATSWLRLFCQD